MIIKNRDKYPILPRVLHVVVRDSVVFMSVGLDKLKQYECRT